MGKKKDIKCVSYLNGDTHLHVSNGNTKVGRGVYCVNTLAGDKPLKKKDGTQLTNIAGTCDGCCKDCKHDCYAMKAQIRYSSMSNLKTWNDNTILAKENPKKFFEELADYLDREMVSAVRYHAMGEIPSIEYLQYMFDIAEKYKDIQFYTYTKRFKWLEEVCEKRLKPTNLVINVSIWHKNYDNPYRFPEFIYDDGTEEDVAKLPHCPAVDRNGHETGITCAQCRRCIYALLGQRTAVYAH